MLGKNLVLILHILLIQPIHHIVSKFPVQQHNNSEFEVTACRTTIMLLVDQKRMTSAQRNEVALPESKLKK